MGINKMIAAGLFDDVELLDDCLTGLFDDVELFTR